MQLLEVTSLINNSIERLDVRRTIRYNERPHETHASHVIAAIDNARHGRRQVGSHRIRRSRLPSV